ncbi:MAG: type II/IV secretion system ATPase subunit [Candidatus Micrarchaeota archaeon]
MHKEQPRLKEPFSPAVLDEPLVRTKITEICEFLEGKQGMEADFGQLARVVNLPTNEIERISKILQEQGLMDLNYPVNILSKPSVRLLQKLPQPRTEAISGEKLLDNYQIRSNNVPAIVEIWQLPDASRPLYVLNYPRICAYTEKFVNYLRDSLAKSLPVETDEIVDHVKFKALKERFYEGALDGLDRELPGMEDKRKALLAGLLLHRMYGLGVMELLMADDHLEEIGVNGATEPIGVYHRKYGWLRTNLKLENEEEIYNYAAQIGRKSGREISLLNPILDAALVTGDRVSATLFPISSNGNTITIRRFARNPWTITGLINEGTRTMSAEMAAFLWLAIQYEMNIIVAGGTASGKTSTLNTLTALIPPAHRIVSIEDTRELSLPSYLHWNWVPLLTRAENPEGKGRVSMLDLMVESLRMRPDRIIVGEVRRKREAEVMFEAMHTGHAVYATLHADSASQVIRRLTEPPISIPGLELESLDLIVVQYRDRRKGIRRTYEISELTQVASESAGVSLNTLFKWRPRTDTFDKANESSRVFAELNLHTGLTVPEIQEDLLQKRKILEWMALQGISSSDEVGDLMNFYYKDPQQVAEAASKNRQLNDLV